MSLFDVFGFINTVLIFVSLLGVFSQLNKIWLRKKTNSPGKATEILSLNKITTSFLAYFSFFVYGYSIEPFNHYLVWPRLAASFLVGYILIEIWKDRKNMSAAYCLGCVSIIMILGILGAFFGSTYSDKSRLISTTLIVIITLLLAQAYYHQILLIIKTGKTGAVDIRMSQFILLMDISTILFALCMTLSKGWPLIFLATVSGFTKLIIIYLFYWVKVSPIAKKRRQVYNSY